MLRSPEKFLRGANRIAAPGQGVQPMLALPE